MSVLKEVDTLSDRRDLWTMLHRIHPTKRLRFLEWACAMASRKNSPCPAPIVEMQDYCRDAVRCDRADDRFTNMIYTDLAAIANQYDFDLARAMLVLEDFIRGRELPPVRPAHTRDAKSLFQPSHR